MKKFVINKGKERISKRVFKKKQSTPNFPKNEHLLPPDKRKYVCVSGVKKCSFFGQFGVLCVLEAPVVILTLLPHYQQVAKFYL